MKKLFTLFGYLCLMGAMVTPLWAQDAEEEPVETESPAAMSVSIPELLKEVKFVTKVKPKKKAYAYLFLRSHSRCGFCRTITPQMNAAYKEMKGKGAELIMLNSDPDTEKAAAWAEESAIEFPMITPETAGVVASAVPGSGSGGTPNITVVLEDGEKIEGNSGANSCKEIAANWKELVKEAKKATTAKKAEARKAAKKKKKKSKKKKAKSEDIEL